MPPVSREATLAFVHTKLSELLGTKKSGKYSWEVLMPALLKIVTDENAADIVQSLSAEELNTPFGLAVLDNWLQVDCVRAANWVAARDDTNENQVWIVVREFSTHAVEFQFFCDRLPESSWKQKVLENWSWSVQLVDPGRALDLAHRMNQGVARDRLLQEIAVGWMGTDPDAALDWLKTISDPLWREEFVVAGAETLAATDPDLAADLLVANVKSDERLDAAALNIVDQWMNRSPAKAADWVAQLPEGHTRTTVVDAVSKRWLKSEPMVAYVWVKGLPEMDQILARLGSD